VSEDPARPPPPPRPRPQRWGPRRRWALGAVATLAVLSLVGLLVGRSGPGDAAAAPEPAPRLELPALDGDGTVSLAAQRGRPVVVNFFASWCVPCRRELPNLARVARSVGDDVVFLGVDHLDSREGGRELVAATGLDWPVGWDRAGTVAPAAGLLGLPGTIFVSPAGEVLEAHTGELSAEAFAERLERHFGVRVPPA